MKLFTKEVDKQLFAQYPKGSDLDNQMVVAKIFNPYGRGVWYLLNSDPEDPDYIWAIVDLFEPEMGSVSRSELQTIKVPPFGLGLERDIYFTPKPAKEVFEGVLSGKRYAAGGMTPGRYYIDNSGNELRYVGESQGKLLFKDGEKIVSKSEEDFEDRPKETKLFGIFAEGGETEDEGVDLFEDYDDIPANVQKILQKYDFEEGDYRILEKAKKDVEKVGYTFEYSLDGTAYDLRKIGQKGKSEDEYADGGRVNWKKGVTIKRDTKKEAEKNAKLLAEYYGESGRNFKVEKRDDKYVVTYEFSLTEAMADGGRVKGKNNQTGETYGVVIGSVKKSDENIEGGTEMNVRSGYSSRISEVKLVFDKNGNLYEITDFGYALEGNYPDTSTRSGGRIYNADKKETFEVLSKKYNPAFAKKLIELAKDSKMAHGGKTNSKRYTVNVYYGGEMEDEEVYTDSLEEAKRISQGGEHSEIYDNEKKEFVEIEYADGGEMDSDDDDIDYNSISDLQSERNRLVRWSNQYGSKGADYTIKKLEERIEYLKSKDNKMAKGGKVDTYEVELSAVPNPDYADEDDRGSVNIKKSRKKVSDVEEAKRVVREFIEENDLGSGNWPNGGVYKNGKKIGYISYNGRFWDDTKMAKGGKIRSQKEFNELVAEKEKLVKKLSPKEVAEMWNKNSNSPSKMTEEEAKNSTSKMYLRDLLIEKELNNAEHSKYFEKGGYMAEGGMMDEVNTEVIAVKGNIMGTTTLNLKIKGMRKPQDFIVYPISTEQAGKPITIQSDTRFGYLDLSSGRGLMSQSHANGAYSYHFAADKKVPFKISETDVQKIKEHLSSKASSKAGNSVIFSDNSGAGMMAKGGKLVGKQKNLDVNKNGKLDAEDFKMLRGEKMAMGGKVKFEDKVKAIKESLLKRKKVSPKVQKDYGKTYSSKEAEESAKRIAASQRMKYELKKKFKKGGKTIAQTPAPKKDRVFGSSKNKAGSASSKKTASNIELNESIVKTLGEKAKEYNEKHSSKVSTSTLKAVMRRGMGAFSTSHRPGMTRQGWGYARVNKFLKKKGGAQVKAAYVQDDDLL